MYSKHLLAHRVLILLPEKLPSVVKVNVNYDTRCLGQAGRGGMGSDMNSDHEFSTGFATQ